MEFLSLFREIIPQQEQNDDDDDEDDNDVSSEISEQSEFSDDVSKESFSESESKEQTQNDNLKWQPRPSNYPESDSFCRFCHKNLRDKYELQQHIDRIHAEKSLKCTVSGCSKAFSTDYIRNRHLRLSHGIPDDTFIQKNDTLIKTSGMCEICNKHFGDLRRHNDRLHPKERKFKCKFDGCDRAFASTYLINRHLKQVHNRRGNQKIDHLLIKVGKRSGHIEIEKPTCCMCQKTFEFEEELKDHVEKIHPNPPIKKFSHECRLKCQYCMQKFQRKAAFYQHFIDRDFVETVLHRPRDKRKLPKISECTVCKKILKNPYDLKMHEQRIHAVDRPWKCDHNGCSAAFALQMYLKEHKKNHGARENICEICGYAFQRLSKLNEHLKLHAAGKLIKCSKCIKMYSTKAEFEIHFAKHVANQCNLCDKAYTKREYLNRHMKTEHGGLPSTVCKKCGRQFLHPGYYREHEEKCDGTYKPYKSKKKTPKISTDNALKLTESDSIVPERAENFEQQPEHSQQIQPIVQN